MFQLLQGLKYLHMNKIVHRDIKPDNVLIDCQTATLKIADFGMARKYFLCSQQLSPHVQTLWYRAPELILGERNYGVEVDIWAAGCLFYELLVGKVLVAAKSEIEQLFELYNIFGSPTEQSWPGLTRLEHFKVKYPKFKGKSKRELFGMIEDELACDLLVKMLKMCPTQRPSVIDCLHHPYFAGLDYLTYTKYN
jgi:serine/threonine protein kinase